MFLAPFPLFRLPFRLAGVWRTSREKKALLLFLCDRIEAAGQVAIASALGNTQADAIRYFTTASLQRQTGAGEREAILR
jgi:hypothetical protein